MSSARHLWSTAAGHQWALLGTSDHSSGTNDTVIQLAYYWFSALVSLSLDQGNQNLQQVRLSREFGRGWSATPTIIVIATTREEWCREAADMQQCDISDGSVAILIVSVPPTHWDTPPLEGMEGGRSKLESWSHTLGAGSRGVMRAAGGSTYYSYIYVSTQLQEQNG